jgi:hypothetical protein
VWCKREFAMIAVVMAGLAGCATKFQSTWKDPTADPTDIQGRRLAAFVFADSEAMRRSGEDALARTLSAHGVNGIPGYQVVGIEETSDNARLRSKLQAQGMDGMVLMRVLNTRQIPRYQGFYGPYYSYASPSIASWGYYGWEPVLADTVVTVETMVYSLPDHKLIWAGVSDTTNPSNLSALMTDVSKRVAKQLKKQGLITR